MSHQPAPNLTPRVWIASLFAITLVSICSAAYFAGAYYAQQSASMLASPPSTPELGGDFPILNATAAVTSENYSMATGQISEDAEGLIVLDHNSGLLQCTVVYPRLGRFLAQFTINVADTLGTGGKGGHYIMVTGNANFPRASNRPAAPSVVYVMDTATGNFACYGVPFDRAAMNAGRPQQGLMVLISTGTANPIIDREKLR